MTENQTHANNRKLLIILIAACALLIAITAAAAIMILPLLSTDHIKNTSDALFFDLSAIGEIMSGNALELSAELDLLEKLTGLEGDLHLSAESAHDQSNDNGKAHFSLGLGEDSISMDLLYDSEAVALGGICSDPSIYVSLPRKDLKKAFDDSLFFYGSGSVHSMSMSAYNELIPALESALDPDRQAESDLSLLADKIAKIIEPTSSFVFSNGKLCRKFTILLDREKIAELIELFAEQDASQLESLKASIGDKTLILYYITDGKYITSAHIATDDQKADIDFLYNGNTNGFIAEINYSYGDTETDKTEFRLTYSKTETDSDVTVDITVAQKNVDNRDYSFKLNKNDSSYNLKFGDKEIAKGVFELDPKKIRFTAIDSETDSAIMSFSLERPESIVTEIPEHRPLLKMSKEELTDFFRGIPMKTASDLLKSTVGLDLSAFMTADGKLMLHTDKIMTEASKDYAAYISLLKSTERKIIDTVSKIYIYNDRLDAYILFTYSVKEDTLAVGCAYDLTDEILAEYHIATFTENEIMIVHDMEKTLEIPVGCENEGKQVFDCKYCDYGYEKIFEPLGHKKVPTTARTYIHDGSFKVGDYSQCERCSLYLSASASLYCYYTLALNSSGDYTLVTYEQQHPYVQDHFFVPLPADVDFSITEIRVSLKNNVSSAFFPEGIKRISVNSFPITSKFKILILPSTLTEIEDGAFYGGGKPSKIFYSGSKEDWEKIDIGEYAALWSDVEIVFCPDGVKYDDYKNEFN